jgi:hypothetical protein
MTAVGEEECAASVRLPPRLVSFAQMKIAFLSDQILGVVMLLAEIAA